MKPSRVAWGVVAVCLGCQPGKGKGPEPEEGLGEALTRVMGQASVGDCPNGGVVLAQGVDDDASGTLDDDEIDDLVVVCNGEDGSSCTVADNGDGTATITCEDGTTATVADGVDGSDCTVTDNGDGTTTVSCSDGTSATYVALPVDGVLEGDFWVRNSFDAFILGLYREVRGNVFVNSQSLAALDLPRLTKVTGVFAVLSSLESLTMANLAEARAIDIEVSYLSELRLEALQSVEELRVTQSDVLVTIALPALSAAGSITIDMNLVLATLTFPNLVSVTGGLRIVENPSLPECVIDGFLAQLTSAPLTTDIVDNDDPCDPNPCSGGCAKDCSEATGYLCAADCYASSPYALYHLDGNGTDQGSAGLDATPYGVTTSADRFGNPDSAYGFDGGPTTRLETSTNIGISGNASRTVSAWFRKSSFDPNTSQLDSYGILNWGSLSVDAGVNHLKISETGQLLFHAHNVGDLESSPGSMPFDQEWHHCVVTHDGSSTVLYLDGAVVASASSNTLATVDTTLKIGLPIDQPTWQRPFSGDIDEVAIWTSALSQPEVESLYECTRP